MKVTNRDIEDFENKVNDVHATIEGLLSGKINPSDVDIEFDGDDQLNSEEYKRKQTESKVQRKFQECEQWWELARKKKESITNDLNNDSRDDNTASYESLLSKSSIEYYSKWNKWVPSDPVSLQEEDEKQTKDREEFEKKNPEFCQQFVQDLEARTKVEKENKLKSDNFRITGNNFFKSKHYKDAIIQFMEGIKVTPFDTKLTLNIAQAYIQMKEYEDAMEFVSRTLFLDSKHIKALSRKAYILSVQGKYSEALDSVNAALGYVIMLSKTNPANSKSDVASDSQRTELLTQRYEYQQRIQEQRHENELHLLLSHTSIKPDDSKSAVYGLTSIPAPENSSAINKADIDKIDELFCQLKSLHSQLLQDPTAYELPINLIAQTDNCVNTLYNCSTLRVHVRTSASLGTILLPLIKSLQNNLKIHKHNISNYRTLSLAYGLLASVLNKEFSAKQIVFSEGASSGGFMKEVFQSVVDAMRSRMSDTNDVSQQQLKSATNQLVSAFIRLQIVCVNGEFSLSAEGNPAVAAAVDLKDPSLSSSTVYPPLSDLCATNTSLLVELVDWCGFDVTLVWSLTELLHAVYLSKKGATKLKEAIHLEFPINWHHSLKYSSVITALVTLLVTLVQPVQSTDEMSEEIANIKRTKALEKVLGMFLTLSQWDEVSKASSSASRAVTRLLLLKVGDNNAITAVLQCMKDFPQHSVNCLAILMNLATNAEVREEVATQHGLDLALASLTHSVAAAGVEPHACIANKENIDINARYTGLLSRLVSVTAVSDRLKSAANFELLCHRLQQCCMLLVNSQLSPSTLTDHTDADEGDESAIKWTKQERGYIITILATLTQNNQASTTKVSLDSLINTNSKYNLIVSLMSVFPEPRTELDEVTAASVSLSPCNIESPLLLGNAACCLLNYADNASLIPAIFLGRSKFTARSKFAAISSSSSSSIVDTSDETALNIDKMICAMATCTDTRVRKNISILIAKGCRNEAVKERMTALRGMEMIRALNSLSK